MLVCVNAPGLMMMKATPSASRRLHLPDQLVLGIALSASELMSAGAGPALERRFDVWQGDRAIDRRLARPEQIQIGSIEQQNSRHRGVSPAYTARKDARY